MIKLFRSSWISLIIPILAYILGLAYIWQRWQGLDGGAWHQFTYGLDDAYIHLAYAKHLVWSGVWGTDVTTFTHASSSPGWVFLLAPFALLVPGYLEYIPLVLNVLASLWVIREATLFLRLLCPRFSEAATGIFVAILLLAASLPSLTYTGMEHIMHIGCILIALRLFFQTPRARLWQIGLWIFLAGAFRIETLFLAGFLGLILLFERRVLSAILISISSAIPVTVMGLVAKIHEETFLPHSLLMKTYLGSSHVQSFWLSTKEQWRIVFVQNFPLFVLIVVTILLTLMIWKILPRWKKHLSLLIIGTTLVHTQAAATSGGWYRYEAYLVVLLLCLVYLGIHEFIYQPHATKIRYTVCLLIGIVTVWPLWQRGSLLLTQTHLAMKDIAAQQRMMAQLVERHFRGKIIAANDIGAISYTDAARIIDVWGLGVGSKKIIETRREGTLTTETIDAILKEEQAEIAMIYKQALPRGPIPASWILVGERVTQGKAVVSNPHVLFYALQPNHVQPLMRALQEEASSLPPFVTQTIHKYDRS